MTKIFEVRLSPVVAELICHIHLVQGRNPVYIRLAPEETRNTKLKALPKTKALQVT